jgi:hypothetical protein
MPSAAPTETGFCPFFSLEDLLQEIPMGSFVHEEYWWEWGVRITAIAKSGTGYTPLPGSDGDYFNSNGNPDVAHNPDGGAAIIFGKCIDFEQDGTLECLC